MGKYIFKYLLYSVSIIFYLFAIVALVNKVYAAMYFLIADGVLCAAAAFYVSRLIDDENPSHQAVASVASAPEHIHKNSVYSEKHVAAKVKKHTKKKSKKKRSKKK